MEQEQNQEQAPEFEPFDPEEVMKSIAHTNVSNMKFMDAAGITVDCMVTFPSIQADPIPYSAGPVDNAEHGGVIYEEIMSGKWGEISPFDPDADKARQVVVANFERDVGMNSTDWLVTRHRDEKELGGATSITEAQYLEVLAYRRDLRDWPSTAQFPAGMPTAPVWINKVAK